MTRRRWIGLALVVVVAAVVVWAVHDSGDDGSALRSNGAIVGGRVESGRPFAYGSLVVYNRESEPVVLRDVRLSGLSGTANLRLIGGYAVNPRKTPNLVRSFPRGVPRKALDGTPVKPHDGGVAVLLTLVKGRGGVCRLIVPRPKNPRTGCARFKGLTFTYEQDGQTKTQTVPGGLNVWTTDN